MLFKIVQSKFCVSSVYVRPQSTLFCLVINKVSNSASFQVDSKITSRKARVGIDLIKDVSSLENTPSKSNLYKETMMKMNLF